MIRETTHIGIVIENQELLNLQVLLKIHLNFMLSGGVKITGFTKDFNTIPQTAVDQAFFVVGFKSPSAGYHNRIVELLTELGHPLGALNVVDFIVFGEAKAAVLSLGIP